MLMISLYIMLYAASVRVGWHAGKHVLNGLAWLNRKLK